MSNNRMVMNDELGRMWEEVVVSCCDALFNNASG
jgi:hypothetical protein